MREGIVQRRGGRGRGCELGILGVTRGNVPTLPQSPAESYNLIRHRSFGNLQLTWTPASSVKYGSRFDYRLTFITFRML